MESYRMKWIPRWTRSDAGDPQFGKLHEEYWGKTEWLEKVTSSHQDRVIRFPVLFSLVNLASTKGLVYIAERTTEIYDRVQGIANSDLAINKVVLKGSPGIGKSYDLLYLLLRLLAQGKTTLFSSSDGKPFMFDEDGVWYMRKESVSHACLPTFEPTSASTMVWSLIDASPLHEPELSGVSSNSLFSILSSSPQPVRVHDWEKRNGIVLIVDPWRKYEVEFWAGKPDLINLPDILQQDGALEKKKKEIIEKVGPSQRDIRRCLMDETAYMTQINDRIGRLADISSHHHLFESVEDNLDNEFHQLIEIRRKKVSGQQPWQSDSAEINWKSSFIERRVYEHYATVTERQACAFFLESRRIPSATGFTAAIFESLAIAYLDGSLPRDLQDPFSLSKMEPAPTARHANRFRHEYISGGFTNVRDVITVRRRGAVIHSTESLESQDVKKPRTSALANSTECRLPVVKRIRYDYDEIADITRLDTFHIYVPSKRNNPLFDAFFLEGPHASHTIVWVCQMTIARNHGAPEAGFKLLKEIQSKVESVEGAKTVEFRYVLVAPIPFAVSRQAVHWHMPNKIQAGEVFVLYLNLSLRDEWTHATYKGLGFTEDDDDDSS